jgi:hypothetical protein
MIAVWKEPSFFLAHPAAISAFGRECTRRGVPPVAVTMYGAAFLTWRGLPIVPCAKLLVDENGRSSILLIRSGEEKQGVIGLYQSNVPGEQSNGLSVRFMGIDSKGIGLYLLSIYCSAAILTEDAIAVLENVDTGFYMTITEVVLAFIAGRRHGISPGRACPPGGSIFRRDDACLGWFCAAPHLHGCTGFRPGLSGQSGPISHPEGTGQRSPAVWLIMPQRRRCPCA